MSDSVAEKSGFLKMYMSSHPDTLVGYAKWYGKVTEPIKSAEMTTIDSKSMLLTCTLKNGTKKESRVVFDPPLAGYNDVKPRLLEMKALAQEGLGMIKAPQITTYRFPTVEALKTGLLVSFILYCRFSPATGAALYFAPAQFVQSLLGATAMRFTFYFFFTAHILESLYTLSLCIKHKTGFLVGALYVLTTLFFGYPIWSDLRKRIQEARIDSVMKVQ